MRAHTVRRRRVRKGGNQKACTERLLCGAGCAGDQGACLRGPCRVGLSQALMCGDSTNKDTACARRRGAVRELAIAECALCAQERGTNMK